MSAALAFEGIRILEQTTAWAGPFCTKHLAFLGAEVIKVEAPLRPDSIRGNLTPVSEGIGIYPKGEPGERPWERTGPYHERYRNKLGLSLDLSSPEGREIFKELSRISDVVVCNYRATVMDNLGLGYSVLKELNPGIIMIQMPGFATSGPYKEYSSFGNTLEALTGSYFMTGYPDGEPLNSGLTWPDPVAGVLAVGCIAAALRHRQKTGEGMLIELSQMEIAARALGGFVMEYAMTGRIGQRMGNRDPVRAPQGCYRCKGDDQWLTISVGTDGEWNALCKALDEPKLAEDARFMTPMGRLKNHDELDRIIEGWTLTQDKVQAMRYLQETGVPAGAVMAYWEHFNDPHFKERGFFQEVHSPQVGAYPYQSVSGFRLSKTPGYNRLHAPTFGEHNRHLLQDTLGLTDEQMTELEQRRIISDRPLANPPRAI